MRGLWILIALALAVLAVWWLSDGRTHDAERGLVADDSVSGEQGPALQGRGKALVAEKTEARARLGAGAIRGSVEDTQGRLLPGVTVHLHKYLEREYLDTAPGRWLETEASGGPETYERLAETTTAEDGTFSFLGLRVGDESYRVSVLPDEPWVPAMRHATYLHDNAFLRIVLGRGDPLRLRVVDVDGQSVAAHVTCWRERDGPDWYPCGFEALATDAEGRLTVNLPEGAFRCSVHAAGTGWREDVLVETPQSREVVIPLGMRGGATVAGTVRDTAGKPVAGARILIASRSGRDENLHRLGTTAPDGTYRIDGLHAGTLELLGVTATGFVTVENHASGRALVPGDVARIDVTMIRGGVLTGTVRGPDGRPLAGARVRARAEVVREGLVGSDLAVTDGTGQYRMSEVPLGSGHVRVSKPGYYQPAASKGWYMIQGESARHVVDVALARGSAVAGRVVDTSGTPVAGASVFAQGSAGAGWWPGDHSDRAVLSRADGRFAYPGLPPSKAWRLTARTEEALSLPVTVETQVSGLPPADVELVLQSGCVIEGRVVRQGETVADLIRVQAVTREGEGRKTVALRTDGTFRIPGLRPGTYDVRVVDRQLDAVSESVQVTLHWGRIEKDVVLEMRKVGRIAGVVVDERGEPISNLTLHLDVSTPGSGRHVSTETNLRGRFEFTSVPDEGYAFPILIGGVRTPGTYEPGDLDVRLVHTPPARVRFEGTVLLPDGSPAVTGKVMLWEITKDGLRGGGTVPISDGHFAHALERRAPDSTFSAEVREVFDVLGRLVSIQPTEIKSVEPETPIEFRLVAGLEIQGLVVDADGAPVEGVQVTLVPPGERLHFRRKNMNSRADGSFHFGSLAPGGFRLRVARVSEPWIAPPDVNVRAGDKDVRIQLVRGQAVRGQVRDAKGAPLAGAGLTWSAGRGHSVSARSGSDGAFELAPVPPGIAGTVTVEPPQERADDLMPAMREGVRAGVANLELALSAGVFLTGEVTGPEGETLPTVWVTGIQAGVARPFRFQEVLRASKRLRVGPVPPGRYTLHVQAAGEYVVPDSVEVIAPSDAVRIVIPKGLTLKGTLVGAERPEQYAVAFTRLTPDGPSTMSGSVTASGQFLVTLRADESGTLSFHLRGGGDLYGLVENARASAEPITVRLQRGERIEGRIADYADGDEGYVYIQALSGFNLHAQVAQDGSFVVRGVPPGTYDLHGISARQKLVSVKGIRAGTQGHVLRRP